MVCDETLRKNFMFQVPFHESVANFILSNVKGS